VDKPHIDPKYILKNYRKSNKDYVTWAGLLDAAHRYGLIGSATEVVQVGSPVNGWHTVVHAVLDMGENGKWSGLGEVNGEAQSESPIAKAAPIRMAETRAKSRALRDGLNISEFEVDEDLADAPVTARIVTDPPTAPIAGSLPVRSLGDVITEAQKRWPDKVKVGTTPKPDPVAAPDPEPPDGAQYRGDHTVNKRPAPAVNYDKDPAKLIEAAHAWKDLCDEAAGLNVLPPELSDETYESVSLMRAAWRNFNLELRDKRKAKAATAAPSEEPLPVPDA